MTSILENLLPEQVSFFAPSFFGKEWEEQNRQLQKDLDDIEHDARVDAEQLKDERRLGGCDQCVAKLDFPDDYRERVCRECEHREEVSDFTQRLLLLSEFQEGGYPFEQDDLTFEEWRGLARVRAFKRKLEAKSWKGE